MGADPVGFFSDKFDYDIELLDFCQLVYYSMYPGNAPFRVREGLYARAISNHLWFSEEEQRKFIANLNDRDWGAAVSYVFENSDLRSQALEGLYGPDPRPLLRDQLLKEAKVPQYFQPLNEWLKTLVIIPGYMPGKERYTNLDRKPFFY
jgi:hypothetical protein